MIRPWGDSAKLASAQAWSDKFFSGKFVGDELAKRGYVVFSIDSIGWGDRGPMSYERQQALASNFSIWAARLPVRWHMKICEPSIL